MLRTLSICAALLAAGCALPPRRASPEPGLTPREESFARALAAYAQGLIYEVEEGGASTNALAAFEEAARLDPQRQLLHSKAAVLAFRAREPERAIAILEESCRANPRSLQARLDLATAYQITGDIDNAVRHFEIALKQEPDRAGIYLVLAQLHFRAERDATALSVLRRALRRTDERESVLAYVFSQASEFAREEQFARARAGFEFLAAHSPEQRGPIHHVIGQIHEQLGDPGAARSAYRRALADGPADAEVYMRLGLLLVEDELPAAIAVLEDGREQHPDDDGIVVTLAFAYGRANRIEEAIECYARIKAAADADPERELRPHFYVYYGAACERAGQFDRAVEIFEEAVAKYPDHHVALNYVAYMWAERGVNLDRAHAYVTRALEHDPENGAYLDTLGWVYYQRRDYERALEYVQRALELLPDDPTLLDHLGDIHLGLGDREQALAYWKRSLAVEPGNEDIAEKINRHKADAENVRDTDAAGCENER